MRRSLVLSLLLLCSCTPQMMQVVQGVLGWALCGTVPNTGAIGPTVADALRSDNWEDRLSELLGPTKPAAVECSVAEIARFNRLAAATQPQSGRLFVAPPSDSKLLAERGSKWLRDRGWKDPL